MIRVRGLSVTYPGFQALHSLDLDVAAGECLVVTGPSGCGKSTLARVLTGLIPQSIHAAVQGEVQAAGLDVLHSPTSDIARHVGAVFQNPRSHLFHLRVEDEVAFGPRNLGLPEEETSQRVGWALEALEISDLRERAPARLSGGQIQRVAIASALAMRPQVLVLDEPTASLDMPGTASVIAALEYLRARFGLTLVLVEHRLAELRGLADRILVLEDGRIASEGSSDAVLSDHILVDRCGLRPADDPEWASWDDLLVPNPRRAGGENSVLSVQDLSAGYEGRPVLRDVNLEVAPGEFLAVVGDNGAGKSTLALAAAGLIKPVSGRVLVRGTARPRPGLDIALLFQNPADQLFTDSVDEEVAFAAHNYNHFEPILHEETLQAADLSALRARRPFTLSMGQQQRTALASCLELRPALVILDEPTLGQDWRHLRQLMDMLLELNRQGTAVVLISHDVELVRQDARRVVMMKDGRIELDGHMPPARLPVQVCGEVAYARS